MAMYLITGGAGFIGSHLTELLLREGHRVRIVDNFSTGRRSNVCAGTECVEADITDFDSIRSAFRGVDGVFQVAALPRVQFSIEHPRESNAANVTGTLHVLEAARDVGSGA